MFNKILVTLDGSLLAERALPLGVEMAQIHGAELLLLRVAEGEPSLSEKAVGYTWIGADQRKAKDSAESHAYLEQITAALDVAVQTYVKMAESAEKEIVRFAKTEGIDLIIMSTHGRTGLTDLIMGSVAKGVVAAAPCPVVLVRAGL